MSMITALLFASPVALLPGGTAPSVSGPVQAVSVSALALAGPVLPVSVSTPSPGELKCSGRGGSHADMPETVVILDDKIIEVEIPDFDLDDHDLKNSDIYSFGFVCWRWIEEHYGFQVNSTGVYMVTVDWLKQREEHQLAALGAVVAAQDRHRESHGEYAHGAGDLTGFGNLADYGLPSHFVLELRGTGDTWAARLGSRSEPDWESRGDLEFVCLAYVGAVPEEWKVPSSGKEEVFKERQVLCSTSLKDRTKAPD
ncbi:MAG: hypothetical protein OXI71_07665 [Gemmatimonadota bacterium]|nr:hypothetical protein [Gemmatimonadota bacterium]